MNIEIIEKKLKINKNTCVHCSTLELAIQVLSIFHQLGLRWNSEMSYTLNHHNWDNYKEDTVYHPFRGGFSSLEFAQQEDYKIIHAEKFIALHTEGEEFDLENYIPKGELEGFPKEIIARMLECQEEQGNPRNVSIFESRKSIDLEPGGFDWYRTKEKGSFWYKVINDKNFNLFFERYPKQDYLGNYIPKGELEGFPKEIIVRMLNYQEEQWNKIDISVFERDRTAGEPTKGFVWGKTKEGYDFWNEVIRYKNFALFFARYPKKQEIKVCSKCHKEKSLSEFHKSGNTVHSEYKECRKQEYQELKNNKKEEDSQEFRVGDEVIDIITRQRGKILEISTNDGSNLPMYVSVNKHPRILHYRDDYDYDVIDFNNLPKRQKVKKWRAKEGETYYSFSSKFEVKDFCEDGGDFDNKAYKTGNYFQTKEEAQEVADKLNKYFQELLQ